MIAKTYKDKLVLGLARKDAGRDFLHGIRRRPAGRRIMPTGYWDYYYAEWERLNKVESNIS